MQLDRRGLLQTGAASLLVGAGGGLSGCAPFQGPADYSLKIAHSRIEVAPGVEIATKVYNGAFPGPLLRFDQSRPVVIDLHNDTDQPEQVHWHGQKLPVEVDGATEEGTPPLAPRSARRIRFTPGPAGFRFYHTHAMAMGDLTAGQYNGQVGPVFITPRQDPGRYDQEIFLTLKEFEPSLSQGGDMAMDFLDPAAPDEKLKAIGEGAMQASLARGMPHGYEVGYKYFTINGRMLGHAEPLRVKAGERVLFHVLNGSATEIRSLALPGHVFKVVGLDGNPVATQATTPVLWLGTAERVSAIVEMNHPGVWVMGDLADDDRSHGMGLVVEYAGRTGPPQWFAPPSARWNYADFGLTHICAPKPDEILEMTFAKENAADKGFNRWTINGVAFSDRANQPLFTLQKNKRYRLRLRNQSDDIHPVHLHRHSFEITKIAGRPTCGVLKDVVMLNGYQETEVDFVADNPGRTLFHCHQLLHMDFGFMCLFDYR